MIRAIRHRLRLIRYYSAARERTAWTTALDAAIFIALFLSPGGVWLSDVLVFTEQETGSHTARLVRFEGRVRADIVDKDFARKPWREGVQIGRGTLREVRVMRGWPLTTSVEVGWLRLDLELFARNRTRQNVDRNENDPVWRAIDGAVREAGDLNLIKQWEGKGRQRHHRYLAWFFSAVLWWFLLLTLAAMMIGGLQFLVAWGGARRGGRRLARQAKGWCPECGYDLQGLEFSPRCPECGVLIY